MKTAAIFDIDGTLASSEWRSALAEAKLWELFHEGIIHDAPIPHVVHELRRHEHNGDDILLITNRTERWRANTEEWLDRWGIPWHKLLLRSNTDVKRMGSDVKRDQYRSFVRPHYTVTAVYEDHKMIVPMWRTELPNLDIPMLTDPGFPPLHMSPRQVADWIAVRLASGTVVQ